MANYLYNDLLMIICNKLDNWEVDRAVEVYRVMTLALINYYGLKKAYKEMDVTFFDTVIEKLMLFFCFPHNGGELFFDS